MKKAHICDIMVSFSIPASPSDLHPNLTSEDDLFDKMLDCLLVLPRAKEINIGHLASVGFIYSTMEMLKSKLNQDSSAVRAIIDSIKKAAKKAAEGNV